MKDSIEFSIEQNGVSFRVNGCSAYEFLKFSGQKHATLFYVTKIVFPQARIPLQTDVLVTSENVDTIKPRYFHIGVIAAAMIYLPYSVYDGLPQGSYNGIE